MTLSELLIGRIQGESKFQSLNSIAKQYGLSWRTVRRALNYKGRVARRNRPVFSHIKRRRHYVSAFAKKKACKQGRWYPIFSTANAIRKALLKKSIIVSKRTVVRDLHATGLACRVRRRVPTREPAVIQKRLQFCVDSLPKPKNFAKMVWSDEHTVSINDHTSRTMWVDKNGQVIPRERRRLHNIPRVMVWAAVGVGFKSPIILFPQTTTDGEGNRTTFHLDTKGYIRRCLSTIVSKLSTQRRIFQQDGAKPHQNNRVREYLLMKGVEHIEHWPPYSPDLNMIELVWPILNRRIAERHPTTMPELQAAIKTAWGSITQPEIDAVCGGFQSRLRAVVKRNGRC